jgi:NAD(P)H-dependent FMN reductase
MLIRMVPTILVIMGSVRAGRRCPQIAQWVAAIAESLDQFDCEIIDLKDWNLPPDDEAQIPAKGIYSQEHTKKWAAKIASASGFVIVSPQYNWGYPAPLKNALDHAYREWAGKPLVTVTYGGHGGDKCAAQLRQVAEALALRSVATSPEITVARELIVSGEPQTAEELMPYEPSVRQALDELTAALVRQERPPA